MPNLLLFFFSRCFRYSFFPNGSYIISNEKYPANPFHVMQLFRNQQKFTTKVNIKFANELSTCISEVNSTFTAELDRINNDLNNKLNEEVNAGFGKINTELNSKLTAEIEKFKACDTGYASEPLRVFLMINNVTIRPDEIEQKFSTINATIQVLVNNMVQHSNDVDGILAQRT